MYASKDASSVKILAHTVHVKCFLSECVLMSIFKFAPTVKDLVHTVHGKGFSPEF